MILTVQLALVCRLFVLGYDFFFKSESMYECVCVLSLQQNMLSHNPVAFFNQTATGLPFEEGGEGLSPLPESHLPS